LSGLAWFRMYAEFATDPDIQSLAFEDQRHYIVVLCLKCSGTLDKEYPSADRRYAVIRRTLGLDSTAIDECKRRLMEAGLIDCHWQPMAWDKRQFLSDSSTERVREFRKRQGNVSETPSETDTESETETEKTKKLALTREPPPAGLDLQVWNRWEAYKREIRKPIKPASLLAAQRKLAGFGSDQAAVVEQSVAQGWTGLFPLKDQHNGTRIVNREPRISALERVRRANAAALGDDPDRETRGEGMAGNG
jgi:hypothetical protein